MGKSCGMDYKKTKCNCVWQKSRAGLAILRQMALDKLSSCAKFTLVVDNSCCSDNRSY